MPSASENAAAIIFETVATANDVAEHYAEMASDFEVEPTLTREFAQITASLLKLNASLVKNLYEENATMIDRIETLLNARPK